MSRLARILKGEYQTDKKWTVWYYDGSITSRVLKFLFGTKGCYRVDCDKVNFFIPAEGFTAMIDEKKSSAQYIWTLQMEKYVMNHGFVESAADYQQKMIQAAEKQRAEYAEQMSKVVPDAITQDMFG